MSLVEHHRVLIAEDNDDAREVMRLLLEMHGHEVFEAANGAEAVALALEMRPEIFFIDIGLPVMDGYEVARRLREAHQQGRMVALTGYGEPEDVRRSVDAGFDEHLVKPVAPSRLIEIAQKGF